MSFEAVAGQDVAVSTLERALAAGLVHHAYRFEGPDGVGKERTAFALAQALLCPEGGCGTCSHCKRVGRLSEVAPHVPLHPDCVLLGRALYPPASIGRSNQEINEISIDQVRRVVLDRAQYGPHEAPARIFIVREAERLSIGAANALLKTLEEPRPATHFVLLTARPDKLLDTIRSRTLPIRFGPLGDSVLRSILQAHDIPTDRIAGAVASAGGSASSALAAANPEQASQREEFVSAVMDAVTGPTLGRAVKLGENLNRNREQLADGMRALAAHLARRARSCVNSAPDAADVDAHRHAIVLECIEAVERNASHGLTVATLVMCLRDSFPYRRQGAPPIPIQRR